MMMDLTDTQIYLFIVGNLFRYGMQVILPCFLLEAGKVVMWEKISFCLEKKRNL